MNRRDLKELARLFGLLSQLGLMIVVAIFLGGALGMGLQKVFGVLGLLVGILVGIGGAAVSSQKLLGAFIRTKHSSKPALPDEKES